MREIKIWANRGNIAAINSDAKTLGELKADLSRNEIGYVNMSFVHGTQKVTYMDDSSPIDEGPFTLFLLPAKNEFGASNTLKSKLNLLPRKTLVNMATAVSKDYGISSLERSSTKSTPMLVYLLSSVKNLRARKYISSFLASSDVPTSTKVNKVEKGSKSCSPNVVVSCTSNDKILPVLSNIDNNTRRTSELMRDLVESNSYNFEKVSNLLKDICRKLEQNQKFSEEEINEMNALADELMRMRR